MFTETSLRKIKDFSANDPVVSLYLNTEPNRGNAETHRLRLRNMTKDISLKQAGEGFHPDWLKSSGGSAGRFTGGLQ